MSNDQTLPCHNETKVIPRGGLVIRYARKLRGYSQAEYSTHIGLGKNTLGNWERGQQEPSFFMVMTILNDLKVDLVEAYHNAQ
ncbi:MAG: helix-turn-helix transcriptional regulator [Pseudomonadota bacterium]